VGGEVALGVDRLGDGGDVGAEVVELLAGGGEEGRGLAAVGLILAAGGLFEPGAVFQDIGGGGVGDGIGA